MVLRGMPVRIQPKLMIGATDDPLEHEADRIAEQVMRMPEPCAQCAVPPGTGGAAATPVLSMKSVQAHASGTAAPPIVHEILNSPGQPLDGATRAFMEPRFGRDFSAVRVHADAGASEAAASIAARAFTAGHHLAFGAGEYAPRTDGGRRLLAHELAHTVQQSGNVSHVQRQPKFDDDFLQKNPNIPSWMGIIPDAVAASGDKKQNTVPSDTNAHGPLTDFRARTFSYHSAGQRSEEHEIATGSPLAPGVKASDVDQAIAAIRTARAALLPRYLAPKGGDHSGYMSTTAQDEALATNMSQEKPSKWAIEGTAGLDWKKGTDAAQSYTTWLATALPTSLKDQKDKKWLVYKKVSLWEGNTSAINAYDRANITWGSGFAASGGQAQELTQKVFEKSPQSRDAFFNAGIALDNKSQYVVVDVDKKWKLRGFDAELYIRASTVLQSLMIDVAQGLLPPAVAPAPKDDRMSGRNPYSSYYINPLLQLQPGKNWSTAFREIIQEMKAEPKQAVLDANYETFLENALSGIPSGILTGWGVDEIALAAHAIHAAPGIFTWTKWAALKAVSIADIAEYVLDKGGESWFSSIVIPQAWIQFVRDRKKKEKEKKEKEKKEKEATEKTPESEQK